MDGIRVQQGAYYYGSKSHRKFEVATIPQGTKFVVEKAAGNKFWNVLIWGERHCMPAFKIHKKCKEIT